MAQEAVLSDVQRRSVEDAFTAMAPRLWRALLLYSGNRELADDAVSEAFAQAIAASSSIRDVRAWVWTVAFKIAAGEMSRRAEQGGGMPVDLPVPDDMDPTSLIDLVRAIEQIAPDPGCLVAINHSPRSSPLARG